MKKIHKYACIGENVIIGENVEIGPFTYIDGYVKIGDNTKIGSNVYITGWTDIGKNNEIHTGSVIGNTPQDVKFKNEKSFVIIGDNNIIREYVTIHRGTGENTKTIIGNNNMLMAYTHVAHNCEIKNNVVIVNQAALAGHVIVYNNAFISAVCQIHQFVRIGSYAMCGASTRISKDVPPFMLVVGQDTAKVYGLNVIGLRRGGFSPEEREIIKKAYNILYHSNLNVSQAVKKLEEDSELNKNKHVKELIEFIKNSKRGICAHK